MLFLEFPYMLGLVTEDEGLTRAGDAVVRRREELGMSQIALATAAGVDPKTLRGLETGQRWPQVQKRAAIAEALGWEPRTLERIRADIKSPEHAPRFNSSDAILEAVYAVNDEAPSAEQLRNLRRMLKESEIDHLPSRVRELTYPHKLEVNKLVTELEDLEEEEKRKNDQASTTPEPRTPSQTNQDQKTDQLASRRRRGRDFTANPIITHPAAADDRGPRDEGDSERRAREQDEAALHSQEPDDE